MTNSISVSELNAESWYGFREEKFVYGVIIFIFLFPFAMSYYILPTECTQDHHCPQGLCPAPLQVKCLTPSVLFSKSGHCECVW